MYQDANSWGFTPANTWQSLLCEDLPERQRNGRALKSLCTAAGATGGIFIPSSTGAHPVVFGFLENPDAKNALMDAVANAPDTSVLTGHTAFRVDDIAGRLVVTGGDEEIHQANHAAAPELPETQYYGYCLPLCSRLATGQLYLFRKAASAIEHDRTEEKPVPLPSLYGRFESTQLSILDYLLDQRWIDFPGMLMAGVPKAAPANFVPANNNTNVIPFLMGLHEVVSQQLNLYHHRDTHLHQENSQKLMDTFMHHVAHEHLPGCQLSRPYTGQSVLLIDLAAKLHDIGKLYLPLGLLDNNHRYSEEEREQMQRHPNIGYDILAPVDPMVARIAGGHHLHAALREPQEVAALQERNCNIKAPYGTIGHAAAIPTEVRMMQICDRFEALSAIRSYQTGKENGGRSRFSPEQVVGLMMKMAKSGENDPELTYLFFHRGVYRALMLGDEMKERHDAYDAAAEQFLPELETIRDQARRKKLYARSPFELAMA